MALSSTDTVSNLKLEERLSLRSPKIWQKTTIICKLDNTKNSPLENLQVVGSARSPSKSVGAAQFAQQREDDNFSSISVNVGLSVSLLKRERVGSSLEADLYL